MTGFVLRRILYVFPLLLGVYTVTFIVFNVAGGNPAYTMAGKNASAAEIAQIEKRYGLDRPLPVRYVDGLWKFLKCDFGRSYRRDRPIGEMIRSGMGYSLALAVPAFFIGLVVSIFLAMIAAFFVNSFIDRTITLTCIIGMNFSMLIYIIVGQYVLAYQLRWFPVMGYAGVRYYALPVLISVAAGLGWSVRFYRTVFLEETRRDYVTTAYAKGLPTRVVMFKHILRNALIPVVTQVVISIPFLYTGSLLLESYFGIPGLGRAMVDALNSSDWPVLQAFTFIGAVLYILANLASDLCYALVDPRVTLR